MMDGTMNQGACLTPNCARAAAPALGRGLCMVCYSKAKKMVEAGVTTWAEIVALGLATRSDAADGDSFTEAFNRAKEEKNNATDNQ